ncbi:hypothetical protein B0H21DRAFT_711760 [Amylocystis lapponica]|nr:hypothetical protein B0H21DRAFT_711760 [Amylocystis lapponica]
MSEAENLPMYRLCIINAKTTGNTTSMSKEAPNLYVKIRLPGSKFEKKTNVIKKCYGPVWDESFTIKGVKDSSSEIRFDLKHKPSFLKFHKLCFGTINLSIDQLIIQCRDNQCPISQGVEIAGGVADAIKSQSQTSLQDILAVLFSKLSTIQSLVDEIAKYLQCTRSSKHNMTEIKKLWSLLLL